jgi:hypothetical protein
MWYRTRIRCFTEMKCLIFVIGIAFGVHVYSIEKVDITFGTLVGTVYDASTGDPIAGALVELFLDEDSVISSLTDSNGLYVFPIVPGEFIAALSATAEGYYDVANVRTAFKIVAGGITVIDIGGESAFQMISKDIQGPAPIAGTVVDLDRGVPLANVHIEFTPGSFDAWTDSTGVFSITVPSGSYTVSVFEMLDPVTQESVEIPYFEAPALLTAIGPSITEAPVSVKVANVHSVLSDVDGDGDVGATDIQDVINSALDLGEVGLLADVNSDSIVNAQDIQLVVNAALGIVS